MTWLVLIGLTMISWGAGTAFTSSGGTSSGHLAISVLLVVVGGFVEYFAWSRIVAANGEGERRPPITARSETDEAPDLAGSTADKPEARTNASATVRSEHQRAKTDYVRRTAPDAAPGRAGEIALDDRAAADGVSGLPKRISGGRVRRGGGNGLDEVGYHRVSDDPIRGRRVAELVRRGNHPVELADEVLSGPNQIRVVLNAPRLPR